MRFMYPMLAILVVVFAACNKTDPHSQTTVSTLSISVNGELIPGGVVNFSCNAPQGGTYSWYFGDGSATSTSATPTHTYNSPGSYTIWLTLNGDPSTKLSTSINVVPDPLFTHLLAGSRTWHHKQAVQFSSDTTRLPDTSFSLTVLNALSVLAGGDTVTYQSTFNNTLQYWHNYTFGHIPSRMILGFDHVRNTIYINSYLPTGSNNDIDIFQYP